MVDKTETITATVDAGVAERYRLAPVSERRTSDLPVNPHLRNLTAPVGRLRRPCGR